MTALDAPQRSPEWMAARLGRITSSRFADVLTQLHARLQVAAGSGRAPVALREDEPADAAEVLHRARVRARTPDTERPALQVLDLPEAMVLLARERESLRKLFHVVEI